MFKKTYKSIGFLSFLMAATALPCFAQSDRSYKDEMSTVIESHKRSFLSDESSDIHYCTIYVNDPSNEWYREKLLTPEFVNNFESDFAKRFTETDKALVAPSRLFEYTYHDFASTSQGDYKEKDVVKYVFATTDKGLVTLKADPENFCKTIVGWAGGLKDPVLHYYTTTITVIPPEKPELE